MPWGEWASGCGIVSARLGGEKGGGPSPGPGALGQGPGPSNLKCVRRFAVEEERGRTGLVSCGTWPMMEHG